MHIKYMHLFASVVRYTHSWSLSYTPTNFHSLPSTDQHLMPKWTLYKLSYAKDTMDLARLNAMYNIMVRCPNYVYSIEVNSTIDECTVVIV